MSPITLLSALLLFQLKHFICDFVVQTRWQIEGKKRYGGSGGLLHAGYHALASLPALWVLGARPGGIATLVFVEFVLHYHIDYGKMAADLHFRWPPAKRAYWMLFGLDQLLHQLTYLGFIAIYARA